MKRALLILGLLFGGCSQASNALQSAAALMNAEAQAISPATTGTGSGTPPSAVQGAAFSTNSSTPPAPGSNFGWSTNIKGYVPPAPVVSTSAPTAATATTITYPGSGNIPAMSTGPGGTLINPTATTPGASIAPTGTVILPATGN